MGVGVAGEHLGIATDNVEEEPKQDLDHVVNLLLHLAEGTVMETRPKYSFAIRMHVQVTSLVIIFDFKQ